MCEFFKDIIVAIETESSYNQAQQSISNHAIYRAMEYYLHHALLYLMMMASFLSDFIEHWYYTLKQEGFSMTMNIVWNIASYRSVYYYIIAMMFDCVNTRLRIYLFWRDWLLTFVLLCLIVDIRLPLLLSVRFRCCFFSKIHICAYTDLYVYSSERYHHRYIARFPICTDYIYCVFNHILLSTDQFDRDRLFVRFVPLSLLTLALLHLKLMRCIEWCKLAPFIS